MARLALLDRNNDSSIPRSNRNQPLFPNRQETGCRGKKPPRHLMEAKRFSCVDPLRQEFDLFQLEDNYLLHLCQKNDWRNVERLCDVSCKVLQENDSSESTLLQAKRARSQLETVDQWGNAALHLVCYHKPPAYVVSALLMAYNLLATSGCWNKNHDHHHPYSYKEDHRDFVLYPNHHGATPLLIACRSGACQAVLQLLMQKDCRALLPPGHQAIHCADLEGNTVFSGLVQRYSMLCKVPHYKRYCTSLYARANTTTTTTTTTTANNDNNDDNEEEENQEVGGQWEITFDGIHFELSSSHKQMPWDEVGQEAHPAEAKGSLMSTPGEAWSLNPSMLLRGHKRNKNTPRIFSELWENIFMLLDAAWKDSLDEPGNSLKELLQTGRYNKNEDEDGLAFSSSWCDYPIHATALVADALPPSIMDLLLRLYHKDWMKHKDDDAVHPIHFAVIRDDKAMKYGSPPCRQEEAPCHSHWTRLVTRMKRQSHLMERFMAMDPGSARLGMPLSNNNRLVFHQAIASGWTWHCSSTSAEGEPGPLQILFRAAPDLLTQRDGETGLYPFQLAAATAAAVELSSSSCSSSYYDHHHEPQQELQVLDTIFQLLRTAPEVLTHVE